MRAAFGSDLPHLLLAAQRDDALVASRGTREIAGQRSDAVEVRSGPERRVLYFDAKDHRLVAMDQYEVQAGGTFGARRLYRDYRPVQGIVWPHAEERLLDGRRVMLLEMRSVVLNSNVKDEVFERREVETPLPAR
jgi:hypothetical protein